MLDLQKFEAAFKSAVIKTLASAGVSFDYLQNACMVANTPAEITLRDSMLSLIATELEADIDDVVEFAARTGIIGGDLPKYDATLEQYFLLSIGHVMGATNYSLAQVITLILHPNTEQEEEIGEFIPKNVAKLSGVEMSSVLDVYRDTIENLQTVFKLMPVRPSPKPKAVRRIDPKRGSTYTLREIEENLNLRDSAHLSVWATVPSLGIERSFAIQNSHHSMEAALENDAIANSRWTYQRETDEWIPVFIWAKDNTIVPEEIVDIEEYTDRYYGGEDGEGGAHLWLTFKGFPRLNPEKEELARNGD